MHVAILAVIGGLVILILASDRLVASAVRVASALGVSAVLIGALVVGLGTSLPELLVSSLASGNGELDVAMANVVGSNTANVTLVLGAAAVFRPVASRVQVIRREGTLMLFAVIGLAAVLVDGKVDRFEGFALMAGMAGALYLLIRWSASHGPSDLIAADEIEEFTEEQPALAFEIVVGVLALIGTVLGAQILLNGALDLGEEFELSATFLGIMLGVGTSLPELATAIAAARRAAPDLVVGNVVGSNLFNSLAVAGAAGSVGPAPLIDLGLEQLVWMIGAVAVAGLFARTGKVMRFEAALLLGGFVAFSAVSL